MIVLKCLPLHMLLGRVLHIALSTLDILQIMPLNACIGFGIVFGIGIAQHYTLDILLTYMTGSVASITVMESAKRAIMPPPPKRKVWNVQLFNHYGRCCQSRGLFWQT